MQSKFRWNAARPIFLQGIQDASLEHGNESAFPIIYLSGIFFIAKDHAAKQILSEKKEREALETKRPIRKMCSVYVFYKGL
ncbi:hypothetical protein [Noviherbaspirillum massiliense]|uniref:hypothetical protein n=1 Tax=Noviherbaspirillum massiliense TaxID=1465823 RepID=UPI000367DD3D|nr:hypothetical protein [Noviherbaspirillum massiliense]